MCGIVGMVGGGSRELLQKMCDCIRHRGPDSEGVYSQDEIHFGMRRLAIIDLSGGTQPIYNEDRTLVITFNGEIYNYQPLKKELEEKGHSFTTNSDTEVILHLYEEEGEKCLEKLNGMFGLAIWDNKKRELFLARDRLGIKPIYLFEKDGFLAWASELKALTLLPQVSKELDIQALQTYIHFLYIPAPYTIYTSCKKLRAGHWLKWKDGAITQQRYWQPSGTVLSDISVQDAVEAVREKLTQAVTRRLIAEVPLGAFLSGGLDSASIVALMSRVSDKPVKTFTMGYAKEYASYNEWDKARLVAKTFGTEHHEYVVEPDIVDLVPKIVNSFDEPFADSSAIPTYLVSRETRQEVTVALSGIGGDEAFGGYPRYLGAAMSMGYQALPMIVRKMFASLSHCIPQRPTATNYGGRIKRFLQGGVADPLSRYLQWMSYCDDAMQSALFQNPLQGQPYTLHRQAWQQSPYKDYLRRIQYLDTSTYISNDLLCMGDRMSMAHSLELRVPFCDHELVDFSLSLPPKLKMQGNTLKFLLKKAMKGILPEQLLHARKQGFMVPLASWLAKDLQKYSRNILEPEKINRQGIFRGETIRKLVTQQAQGEYHLTHLVWALLMFQVWRENS